MIFLLQTACIHARVTGCDTSSRRNVENEPIERKNDMKKYALALLAAMFTMGVAQAQEPAPAPAAPAPCVKKCCAKKVECTKDKCCPRKAACGTTKCCAKDKACPDKPCCAKMKACPKPCPKAAKCCPKKAECPEKN